MNITQAIFPADTHILKSMIREYVAWLDMDLSYRGFEQEMDRFEALFTLPGGLFLIAREQGREAGCVGLKRHDAQTAEVKRLYVRPAFRGQELGRRLMTELVLRARRLGFERLILDAVPQTVVAQQLYEAMGFTETAPYYPNPVPGTRFFELRLQPLKEGKT